MARVLSMFASLVIFDKTESPTSSRSKGFIYLTGYNPSLKDTPAGTQSKNVKHGETLLMGLVPDL